MASVKPTDRAKYLLRYHLAICALHVHEEGTWRMLARALEMQETSLSRMLRVGVIPAELCVKVEELVGRDVMPRELLRPDLFVVEAQA